MTHRTNRLANKLAPTDREHHEYIGSSGFASNRQVDNASAFVGARLAREAASRICLTLRAVNFAGKPRSNGLR